MNGPSVKKPMVPVGWSATPKLAPNPVPAPAPPALGFRAAVSGLDPQLAGATPVGASVPRIASRVAEGESDTTLARPPRHVAYNREE